MGNLFCDAYGAGVVLGENCISTSIWVKLLTSPSCRHRFTAAFVAALLLNNLHCPHRILQQYVQTLTKYEIKEEQLYDTARPSFTIDGLSLHEFTTVYENTKHSEFIILLRIESYSNCLSDLIIRSAVHETLIRSLIGLESPIVFGKGYMDLVRYGMGRFLDAHMSQIVIDDHLMIVAAAMWYQQLGLSKSVSTILQYDTFTELCQQSAPRPYHSAAYLALCFAQMFSSGKEKLNAIFRPMGAKLRWWYQPAELVVFGKSSDGSVSHTILDKSCLDADAAPLAFVANSIEEMVSWLQHDRRRAFCICPPNSGIDLLFAIRLSNKRFAWVFLRVLGAASAETPSVETVTTALELLDPKTKVSLHVTYSIATTLMYCPRIPMPANLTKP